MSVDATIRCSRCDRAYDTAHFESGRVIDCACGARVAAEPVARPLPSADDTRFFADAMLGRLARWLRAAGFDTAYEAHIADGDLVRRAVREERLVLTRDRRLPDEWRITGVLLIDAEEPREQLREVLERCALWDDLRPFTRCTRCNAAVEDAPPDTLPGTVPPAVRARATAFTRCRVCSRVYWDGSHTARMRDVLERLRSAGPLDRQSVLAVTAATTLGGWCRR